MEHIFELIGRYCFQGHTHIPGVFTMAPEFISPNLPQGGAAQAQGGSAEAEWRVQLPSTKAMINVGSVGQPRDGDPRACYAILEDGESVRFRRVEYPCEITSRKIHAIADLDNYLGDRLLQGR
jgi:diadenosine tetraphosphatase ApaH/serine/threonine PP2A family protein phosphatase